MTRNTKNIDQKEQDIEHHKEITDSPFKNINISNIAPCNQTPSYSMNSSMHSSLSASMNFSSFSQ